MKDNPEVTQDTGVEITRDTGVEITRKSYNQIALTYAQVSATMGENLLEFAKKFLGLLEPSFGQNSNILDVGCGPGRDMAWFESHNINVTGVDFSSSMLEIARTQVHGSLVQADMRKLPLGAQSVDGIWCSASLLHLPKTDSPAALLEFKRVLKPSGVLFLAVQEGEGEHLEMREVYGENQRFFARYSVPEITRMLEAAGFEILDGYTHETHDRIWIRFLARAKTTS
jgi:ubiquinone/menaquinone biosynthesis C-methylase UbiE